jgi:hypothetical protein
MYARRAIGSFSARATSYGKPLPNHEVPLTEQTVGLMAWPTGRPDQCTPDFGGFLKEMPAI